MKVYIIGTGMDGRNTLTREAEAAINEAEIIIGAERIVRPFSDLGKKIYSTYVPKDISEKLCSSEFDVAVVLIENNVSIFVQPQTEIFDPSTIKSLFLSMYNNKNIFLNDVIIIKKIPYNVNGKIDYPKLRELIASS